jgi:hypothetical protein
MSVTYPVEKIVDEQGNVLALVDVSARALLGDDELQTDAKTCTGAINELKGTLDSIATNFNYQTLAIGTYASTSANYEYVGLNFTIPTGKHGLVTVSTVYISKNPLGLGIGTSDSTWSTATKQYWLDLDSIKYTPAILLDAGTYYIWAKRDGASSNNPYYVKGLVF